MFYILLAFLLFACILTFVVLSEFVAFLRTRVPFVPTSAGDIEFIVKKLGLSPADTFYDLGSGNGKVVFLVEKLTGAKCVGYELSWWTYLFAKIKSKVKGKMSKVDFKNKNFFKQDWSGANYIYGYLYPPLMARVETKFLADCKPGSIAIIRDFPLPTLKPVETYFMPHKHEIYIYKKV
jgi:SAM-dependent methyltransferase